MNALLQLTVQPPMPEPVRIGAELLSPLMTPMFLVPAVILIIVMFISFRLSDHWAKKVGKAERQAELDLRRTNSGQVMAAKTVVSTWLIVGVICCIALACMAVYGLFLVLRGAHLV